MNKGIFEGADYVLDMESTIRNKKRRRGEAVYNANDDRLDKDYLLFLDELGEFWEAKFVEENDDDPCYIEFLRHLKEHGNAYVCDVSIEHGVLFPIMYEVEEDSSVEIKRKAPQSGLKFSDVGTCQPDGMCRIPKSRSGAWVREDRGLDADGYQSKGLKTCVFGKKISVDVDENYKIFIDSLFISEESVFSKYGNKKIYYESSDQRTTDVETEPPETDTSPPPLTRRPPTPPQRPPVPPQRPPAPQQRPPAPPSTTKRKQAPTDGHNMRCASNKTCKKREQSQKLFSSYWNELHNYLQKPYDQKELEDLEEHLCTPKPVSIHRESRSGGTDRPGKMGESILDKYPDLKDEIRRARKDRGKVLNLLRMFKMFVQKIPAGVPEPWKNEYTKSIMPSRPR